MMFDLRVDERSPWDGIVFIRLISDPLGGIFAEVDPDADGDDIPNESSVLFTAGSSGIYTVTITLDASECLGGCTATFVIIVP